MVVIAVGSVVGLALNALSGNDVTWGAVAELPLLLPFVLSGLGPTVGLGLLAIAAVGGGHRRTAAALVVGWSAGVGLLMTLLGTTGAPLPALLLPSEVERGDAEAGAVTAAALLSFLAVSVWPASATSHRRAAGQVPWGLLVQAGLVAVPADLIGLTWFGNVPAFTALWVALAIPALVTLLLPARPRRPATSHAARPIAVIGLVVLVVPLAAAVIRHRGDQAAREHSVAVAADMTAARAVLETTPPPAGWDLDLSSTSCGVANRLWCGTVASGPAAAVEELRPLLTALGGTPGEVVCGREAADLIGPREEPLAVTATSPCMVDASTETLWVEAVATDTRVFAPMGDPADEGSVGEGRTFPPVRQARTAVAIDLSGQAHDASPEDGLPLARLSEVDPLPDAASPVLTPASMARLVTPAGWAVGGRCDETAGSVLEPGPVSASELGRLEDVPEQGCTSVRLVLRPPLSASARISGSDLRRMGAHLLDRGFRVDVAACVDRTCQVMAALPGATPSGPFLSLGGAAVESGLLVVVLW